MLLKARFSPQHRKEGNEQEEKDIFEGQFFLTDRNIDNFSEYEAYSKNIIDKIKKAKSWKH